MLKTRKIQEISVQDWDDLVEKTYKKPYNFQQQYGCQDRGSFHITVPSDKSCDDEMPIDIPREINGEVMGVKFETWLKKEKGSFIKENNTDYFGKKGWSRSDEQLFWERNFYPDIHTVANDLYKRGLIKAGNYIINIDW